MTCKKAVQQLVAKFIFPRWAQAYVLRHLRGTTILTCGALCLAQPLAAQSLEWVGADGNWNTTDAQWLLSGATPAVPFTDNTAVVFGDNGQATTVVTIDVANVATPQIIFAADGYTIDGSIAITPSDGALAIDVTALAATATISAPLVSAAGDTITVSVTDPTSGLVLSGDQSGSAGTLSAATGLVTLQNGYGGAVALANGATVDVTGGLVGGDVTSSGGTLQTGAGTTLAGDVAQSAGATAHRGTIDGALRVTGGTFTAEAGSRVTDATVAVAGGTLIANGGDFGALGGAIATIDVTDAGTVTIADNATADIDLADGAVTIEAGQTLSGEVTLNEPLTPVAGATLTNNGTITGQVTNVDGTVLANGAFNGGIRNTGGAVTIIGDTTADVQNRGGDLTINAGTTLTGDFGGFSPGSAMTNNGTLAGDVRQNFGRFDNIGTIVGNSVISGGQIVNTGTIDGTVTVRTTGVNLGTLTDNGGRITGVVTNSTGAVVATGSTFDAQVSQIGGTLTATDSTFTGGIDNRGGQITISGADGAVTNSDVTINGGALTVEAGQVLAGAINSVDAASRADIAGTLDGNATLFRGTLAATGTIDGTVDLTGPTGVLETDGATITGQITVNAGTVAAKGTTFAGGIVANAGNVTIAGDSAGFIRNAGGQVTVNAGQSLTGDVANDDGAFINNGTIAGDVFAGGGVVTQNAGADTSGLTTISNGGRVDANGGTFTGGVLLQSGGTFNRAASTVVDITNDNGGLDILAGETVAGDVRNIAGAARVAGAVQGTLDVDNGGVTTTQTTVVDGALTVGGGELIANGGQFDGGLINDGGAIDVTSDTSANAGATINAGRLTIDNGATLAADLSQAGGVVVQNGTLSGDAEVSGGTFTQTAGATIAGETRVSGAGIVTAQGGTFAGGVRNQGGAVRVQGAVSGALDNESGDVTLGAAGIWQGDVRNGGTLVGAGGTITGAVVNTGTIDVTAGDLSVGRFAGAGDVVIGDGATLTTTTGDISAGGGLAMTSGALIGDVTIADGATLDLSGGQITGALTSLSDFSTEGAVTIDGPLLLENAADATVANGSLSVRETFDVGTGSSVLVADGSALDAGTLTNAGRVVAQGDAQFSGTFENNGTVAVEQVLGSDGASFNGRVVNTGAITASGTLAFAGGLTNSGTVDLVNGDATDRVTISGTGLSGDGTLRFDVDLSDNEGAADKVTFADGAALTGEVNLRFNILGSGGQQADDVVLIDTAARDPGNFTINADEILDPSGILTYSVTRNAAGDVVIEDGLNPGIAGLAGNIVLTQSLIGSVVNRPSSPFVTSLAYEDQDACGAGMWSRGIAGGASSNGQVAEDDRAFEGQISAVFAGLQLGGDYACFNGAAGGWDIAFGGIGGVNTGQTTQPVFAIDVTRDTNLSPLQTGTTDVDFSQYYLGTYATAVKGPWAVDLQYRVEMTDFSATNRGLNGLPGLGLDDTAFSSRAHTLSGAASYYYSVPETNLTLVPTAGFAFTQIETDPIAFTDRGVVRIDDFDSQIGFIGGSLSQSSFGDDGVSAWRQFLSGTVYSDFASGPTSTFTPVDNSGDRGLTSDNLGTYGEMSFGVNYVRVLQENEWGAMKQWSANARADVRISHRLKSWGATIQARYQF